MEGIIFPNHFCPDGVWIVLFGRLLCPPVPCAPTLPWYRKAPWPSSQRPPPALESVPVPAKTAGLFLWAGHTVPAIVPRQRTHWNTVFDSMKRCLQLLSHFLQSSLYFFLPRSSRKNAHSLLRYFGIRDIMDTSFSLPNCRFAPETQKRPKPDPAV